MSCDVLHVLVVVEVIRCMHGKHRVELILESVVKLQQQLLSESAMIYPVRV